MQKGELRIRVNGSDWTIVITDNKRELTDKSGHICKGTVSYRESKIFIDESVSKENVAHILRHELTHIYIYETQLTMKETYTEEELCEFFAIYGTKIVTKVNSIMKRMEGKNYEAKKDTLLEM